MFSKPFNLDRTVRLAGGILVFALIILLLDKLSGVLLPFFAAWLVAYMLNPLVDFVQDKMRVRNRLASVLLVVSALGAAIFGLGALAANSVQQEIAEIKNLSQQFVKQPGDMSLPPFIQDYLREFLNSIDIENILDLGNLEKLLENILPKAFDIVSSSLQYIAGLVVVFFFILYMFFILMDFHTLSKEWENLVPYKYRKFARQLLGDLATGMDTYFRKQALISFIVGILFSIGFSIIGLPMSVVMGMLVGLLNMVPYMHTLGVIPPLLVALMQSVQGDVRFWITALWIIITFCIIQVIIDGFLVPRIMGKATGLRPAVILLSLTVWGALLGITGMIIALPITTLMVSYYRHYIIEGKTVEDLIQTGNTSVGEEHKKEDSATSEQD